MTEPDTATVTQRVAMKAVIVQDGKLLLLRESSTYADGTNVGRYGVPGGRIEPGEPFEDGLRREVKEETGLEVTIGEPVYVGEWFPVIRGNKNHIVAVFVICRPASGQKIVLSEEHDDFKWVTMEDLQQLNVMPPDIEVAKIYFDRQD